MAKTRDPLHSSEASGAIGGIVYRPHRGSHLVYPSSSVSAAQTPARLSSQQCLVAALRSWQSMPLSEQQRWFALAGPGGVGSSLYIGRKSRLLKYGIDTEPRPVNVSSVPSLSVTCPERYGLDHPYILVLYDPVPGPSWVAVYMQCRLPALHRKPDPKRFRVTDFELAEWGNSFVDPDPDYGFATAWQFYLCSVDTGEQFLLGSGKLAAVL